MKTNKLFIGIVFMITLLFTSVLAIDTADNSLWLTAVDSVDSDTTFYGTPVGIYDNSTGDELKAIEFDGDVDVLDTGFIATKNIPFKININVSFDDLGDYEYIVDNVRGSSDNSGFNIIYNTGTSKIRFYISDGLSHASTIESNVAINTHQTYNIIASWDGTTNTNGMSLIIDGVEILGTNAYTQSDNIINNLFIGSSLLTSTTNALDGKIYNFTYKEDGVLVYELNATSLSDWSGNGNDGEIGTSDQILREDSWDFDNTNNEYLVTKRNIGISGGIDRTLAYWIKTEDTSATQYLVSLGAGSATDSVFGARLIAGEINHVGWGDDFATGYTLNQNQWYFIVSLYDGTYIRYYVDGIEIPNSPFTSGTPNTDDSTVKIGVKPTLDNDFFDGEISTVAIFDKALTSTEVTALYDEGRFYNPYVAVDTEPETVTYFKVTADDYATSGALTDFTVTINGTDYNDVAGTVTTTILSNSTSLWDVTITKDDYETRVYSNTNVSTDLEAILIPFFKITLNDNYDDEPLVDFTATIGVDVFSDSGTGTIVTDIPVNDVTLYDILIEQTNYFDATYNNYDVSTDLVAEVDGTDITFKLYVKDTTLLYDIESMRVRDNTNNINIHSSTGLFNLKPTPLENLSFSIYPEYGTNTLPNSFYQIFSAKDTTEYIKYITLRNNTVTFLDNTTGFPIISAEVTVTYPSGSTELLTTDTNGKIYFDYEYNGEFEFGEYSFEFDKLGYTIITLYETIEQADLTFSTTYNMGRTSLFIDIYDRETGSYMTQSVGLQMLGVFNGNTSTGQYVYTDITLASGDYTVQATSDGYATTEQTFTYTNQETLTVDLFLLNTSIPSAGTIFVEVIDQNYIKRSGATVSLLEYNTASLGYIKIDEAISNSNGEVVFNVELNNKRYIISGTIDVGDETYTDETGDSGTVFKTDKDVVFLKLEKQEQVFSSVVGNLDIDISEWFKNDTSNIVAVFSRIDGLTTTVCIDYYLVEGALETNKVHECTNSSMAKIGQSTGYNLNRSNTYKAEVTETYGGETTLLMSYLYPSENSFEAIFTDYNYTGIILMLVTIGVIAGGFALNKIGLICFTLPIVHWGFALLLFPNKTYLSVAVLITFICIFVFKEIRIKQEVQ